MRELADQYLFETLVRVYRAGEGAPYTGLKPAGTVEPAVAAADKALQSAAVDELADGISNAVREGIKERFNETLEKKKHADDSVEAGAADSAECLLHNAQLKRLPSASCRQLLPPASCLLSSYPRPLISDFLYAVSREL